MIDEYLFLKTADVSAKSWGKWMIEKEQSKERPSSVEKKKSGFH